MTNSEEEKELACDLNYKAEYNRLLEKHKQLCEKHASLEQEFSALESAYAKLNAQMEIVHLIFGRRR